MKNYFETKKTIVPFNRVISICEIFNEDFRVEVEQINNFSEAIQPFFIFPIDQLANYLNWLDLQHKKDLELSKQNDLLANYLMPECWYRGGQCHEQKGCELYGYTDCWGRYKDRIIEKKGE